MSRSPSLGLGAALVLLLGVVGLAPTPAHAAQAQTVTFDSTPPDGVDWFTGETGLGFGYVAHATASSGLQVSYSVAPASAGICRITDQGDYGRGWSADIQLEAPGTCTILADQAGNESYLPAPQASQSFRITRAPTFLSQVRQIKGLLGKSTFHATLKVWYHVSSMFWGQTGYADQPITFTVAGRPICTGTTNADGVATCKGKVRLADAGRLRFTASYPGDAMYQPVSRTATYGLG